MPVWAWPDGGQVHVRRWSPVLFEHLVLTWLAIPSWRALFHRPAAPTTPAALLPTAAARRQEPGRRGHLHVMVPALDAGETSSSRWRCHPARGRAEMLYRRSRARSEELFLSCLADVAAIEPRAQGPTGAPPPRGPRGLD